MGWLHTSLLTPKTAFREPPIFSQSSELQELLLEAVAQESSDIYFQSGTPVIFKVHGVMHAMTERRLQTNEVMQIVNWAAGNESSSGAITQGREVASSYSAKHPTMQDGRGEPIRYRFRVNAIGGEFRSAAGIQIVMRSIRSEPPKLEELSIDEAIVKAATPDSGVVYVSGATGSGKSTTFAAIIRHILEGDTPIKGNIVTLEAPIEYLFETVPSKHSVIFQSEVGRGVQSFAQGVISLMRHDPSLIVVGETRDPETASAVTTAANTGHPVFTTVHANDCAGIPSRILSFYEPAIRDSMMFSVISTCRLLVNQRLVPSLDGRRVALREYIVMTPQLREEVIATAEPRMVTQVMAKLIDKHGVSMTRAAERAFENGFISEAVMNENRAV